MFGSPGVAVEAIRSATVLAGMPSAYRLSELADLRIQAISFFLAVLLASGVLVKWAWNSLARGFPRLPKLNYPRAMLLVGLWGLLFAVVLTMIAGARELMTPGAWERQSDRPAATYRLKADGSRP